MVPDPDPNPDPSTGGDEGGTTTTPTDPGEYPEVPDPDTGGGSSTTVLPNVDELPVDTREKVTIQRDGEFNKIVFESSGKVWYCINQDMVNNYENSINEILRDRLNRNTYATVVEDEVMGKVYYYDPMSYTEEEMKLLYLLDPYGFSKYVQEYASSMHRGSLTKILQYKDSVYKLLFNTSPQHYARTLDGTWYEISEGGCLRTSISEAEFLFGSHPLYDGATMIDLGSCILEIVPIIFNLPCLSKLTKIKTFEEIFKFFNMSYSVGKSIVEGDFREYIITLSAEKAVEDELEIYKSNNYSLSWAFDLFSLSSSFDELSQTLADKPNFYKDVFDYCVDEPNYNIFVEFANSEIESIMDVRDMLN